jgi:hypothetical protein
VANFGCSLLAEALRRENAISEKNFYTEVGKQQLHAGVIVYCVDVYSGRILNAPFCHKHEDAPVILPAIKFCRDCQTVICLTCIISGHNQVHRLRGIHESADEMEQSLSDLLKEFGDELVELGPLRNDLDDWKKRFS